MIIRMAVYVLRNDFQRELTIKIFLLIVTNKPYF